MKKLNTVISSKINRSLVLTLIHRNPMVSRAQLAEMTGLDRSAITHILKELIERGLVDEVEKGKAGARGGRCPIYLRVNHGARTLVAVDVGTASVCAVLCDLSGRELCREERSIHRGADLPSFLLELLSGLRAHMPEEFDRVVVIAISCPGVIDFHRRLVVANIYHGWKGLALGEALERKLGVPVLVENDANAAALGEMQRLGATSPVRSMIYLFLREAIEGSIYPMGAGGALILEGKLWRGAGNRSGEIASVVNMLMSRALNHKEEPRGTTRPQALTAMMADAAAGKAQAQRQLGRIAREIGNHLAELAVFIDPDAVMVEIDPPKDDTWFLDAIQKAFEEHYEPVGASRTVFLRSALETRATLQGLIVLGMERVFVPDSTRTSLLFA